MQNLPPVAYDATHDMVEHAESEAEWTSFSKYCAKRAEELRELAAESKREAIHDGTRIEQVLARFPEFDPAQMKSWAEMRDMENAGAELTAEQKRDVALEIARRAGLSPEKVGIAK